MQDQQVIVHIRQEHLLKREDEALLLDGLEAALRYMDVGGHIDESDQLELYFSCFSAACVLLIETLGKNKVWQSYAALDKNIEQFLPTFLKPFDKYVLKFRELDSDEEKKMIAGMLRRCHQAPTGVPPPPEMTDMKPISNHHTYLGCISYQRFAKPRRLTKSSGSSLTLSTKSIKMERSASPKAQKAAAVAEMTMWVFSDVLYFGKSLESAKRLRCAGARVVLNENHLFLYEEGQLEAVESMSPLARSTVPLLETLLTHLFKHSSSDSPKVVHKKKGSKLTRTLTAKKKGGGHQMPQIISQQDESLRFPHKWVARQLNKPTWCTYCKDFIWGLRLQSWACECGHVIHRRCKFHVPADCGDPGGSLSGKKTSAVRTTGIDHVFSLHNFSRFASCGLCSEFIWGLVKQGYKCDICGYPIHKDCLLVAIPDCTGTLPTQREDNDTDPATRSMSRAALRQSLNIPGTIDEEDDWNKLFVRLESNTFVSEAELTKMMALITRKDAESKKHPETMEGRLLTAEVQLAKANLTAVWDRQEALKRSRSKGLSGVELQLEEFLLCENPAVFLFLNKICDDTVAPVLLKIFTHYGVEQQLVSFFVAQEVNESIQSDTLFRGNSFAVTLCRQWLGGLQGTKYLKEVLSGPISDVADADLSLRGPELEERQTQLNAIVLGVLASIVSSIDAVPRVFYEVSATIHRLVDEKYDDATAIKALGCLFFLRFLTPAILSPDQFQLSNEVSMNQTQTLVLVAKVIQALVNGLTFPERDPCAYFNPLLKQFGSKIDEFLRTLTGIRSTSSLPLLEKPDREELKQHRSNMSALQKFIQNKGNTAVSEAAEVLAEDSHLITLIQDILGEHLK